MAAWANCADNATRAFGLVYGAEQQDERFEARRRLERAHDENITQLPAGELLTQPFHYLEQVGRGKGGGHVVAQRMAADDARVGDSLRFAMK